jgi:hypothetical protein
MASEEVPSKQSCQLTLTLSPALKHFGGVSITLRKVAPNDAAHPLADTLAFSYERGSIWDTPFNIPQFRGGRPL